MSAFTAFLSVIGSALASIAKSIMALFVAKEVGRLQSENEALQQQVEDVQKANEVYNADPKDYPDPYLRD